jgi:LysM repeat protein
MLTGEIWGIGFLLKNHSAKSERRAGDSLSAISRRFYGTDAFVRTIQELNQLSDADLIQAGQVLILP